MLKQKIIVIHHRVMKKHDDNPQDSVRIKKEILSEVEEEIKPGDFLNTGKKDGKKKKIQVTKL